MQDRPTVLELLQAVREFLQHEVIPGMADPHLRYHLLIAVNALRLIEREVPIEEPGLRAELSALQELLDLPREAPPTDPTPLRQRVLAANRELCERIRRGLADAGPWRERVRSHVQGTVEDKLRINNPAQLEALLAELAGEGERPPSPPLS